MSTGVEPFHFESTRPIKGPAFAQQSEEIKWVPLNGAIMQLAGILYFAGLIITIRITIHHEIRSKRTSSPRDYGFLLFASFFGGYSPVRFLQPRFVPHAIRILEN